jgi:hypothetical protein
MRKKSGGNPIPFDFVLEQLYSISPTVRPMFGCHALYIEDKIVLVLRSRETDIEDNGIWIATTPDHHPSLEKDFPSLRNISLLGTSQSSWRNLPADDDNFESDAVKACQFILKRDPRIGKVPGKKARKVSGKR